jgi:hypothetical protein
MNRIKRKATGGNNDENNGNLVGRGSRGGRGAAGGGRGAAGGGRGARGGASGGRGSRDGANSGKRPSERSPISEDDLSMKKKALSSPSKLNIKIASGTK